MSLTQPMPVRMIRHVVLARVAELADARDSKSRGPLGRVGSTPTSGTSSLPLAGLRFFAEDNRFVGLVELFQFLTKPRSAHLSDEA